MSNNLTANIIRKKYIEFFKTKNHKEIPSSSLIPENDPTVLFTTAGMQPLTPYLLGESHPQGKRLVNVQRCMRTIDIDNVGDNTHCTFFEMLGNWSLGDYFKEESIEYSYEFLTSKEWLNIDPSRISCTVFAGDEDAPRDMVSYNKWRELGISEENLYFLGKKDNWWGPAGITGPCGPDTEIFYDNGKEKCSDSCSPACDCGKYVEIWNNVFMEYYKESDGTFSKLKQQNVDTGMGLERILSTLSGVESVYDTPVFKDTIRKIEEISNQKYSEENKKSFRIIADHIRTATFVLGDEKGVTPSNTDQGYILRRIIRRAIRHLKNIGVEEASLSTLAKVVVDNYSDWYSVLKDNEQFIYDELAKEEASFNRTINQGVREFNKIVSRLDGNTIPGNLAFKLFDTYGFPLEFTIEMAQEENLIVDTKGFEEHFKIHQEKSREGAKDKFKSGLIDNSEATTKLHTATHLLHAALREKFGESVEQKGSNITPERLRFDFSFNRKVEKEELDEIENRVNDIINQKIDVTMEELTYEEAAAKGAIGLFKDKYNLDKVKVYSVGDYSSELCDGPHVKNTGELGKFVIQKEQSSSAGVRRIRAVLVDEEVA